MKKVNYKYNLLTYNKILLKMKLLRIYIYSYF